jgi:hypothetical protein
MGCIKGPSKDDAAEVKSEKSVKGMWAVSWLLTILGLGVAGAGLAILIAVGTYNSQQCPKAIDTCAGGLGGAGSAGDAAAEFGGLLGGPLLGAGLLTSLLGITGSWAAGNVKAGGITAATVLYSILFLGIAGACKYL